VGEDGFRVLDALEQPEAPEAARALPSLATLRRTWQRHYDRTEDTGSTTRKHPRLRVRFKANRDLPRAAEGIESPDDPDARDRHKRDTQWTGYMVHVSETCEPTAPHLLTHVQTTAATVHEAQCTVPIQQALVEKALPPSEHLVDAAYISAELLVESHDQHGITLRGPTRPSPGWQAQIEGGYTIDQFEVDWAQQRVRCPQGYWSTAWWDQGSQTSGRAIFVEFARDDCQACPARSVCTRAQQQGRPCGATTPGPVRGPESGTDMVWECRGEGGLSATSWGRRYPLPGGACLWTPVGAVSRAGENPLATRRDRRGDECRPDRRVARRASARQDVHVPLCRTGAGLQAAL
jgi:transposase